MASTPHTHSACPCVIPISPSCPRHRAGLKFLFTRIPTGGGVMGREVAGGELGEGGRERKCGISCRLGPTFIDLQGRGAGRVEGKRGGEGISCRGKQVSASYSSPKASDGWWGWGGEKVVNADCTSTLAPSPQHLPSSTHVLSPACCQHDVRVEESGLQRRLAEGGRERGNDVRSISSGPSG